MLQIALYEPEIAPNTGNIIRLCVNTGADLHLVGKMGFELDDKRLRRAGLDYHEYASLQVWESLDQMVESLNNPRILAFSTRGSQRYDKLAYRESDLLLFGPETRGLPEDILKQLPDTQRAYLPMKPESRSLNLSNSVAIVVYEAWSQLGFEGALR